MTGYAKQKVEDDESSDRWGQGRSSAARPPWERAQRRRGPFVSKQRGLHRLRSRPESRHKW